VNIKSPDRAAALVAFLVANGSHVGAPASTGRLQRIALFSGDRKTVVIDQMEFVVALNYSTSQRDEALEPQIQRAFKKLRARRSTGSLSTGGLAGPLG
jgi:hypothetical protein